MTSWLSFYFSFLEIWEEISVTALVCLWSPSHVLCRVCLCIHIFVLKVFLPWSYRNISVGCRISCKQWVRSFPKCSNRGFRSRQRWRRLDEKLWEGCSHGTAIGSAFGGRLCALRTISIGAEAERQRLVLESHQYISDKEPKSYTSRVINFPQLVYPHVDHYWEILKWVSSDGSLSLPECYEVTLYLLHPPSFYLERYNMA